MSSGALIEKIHSRDRSRSSLRALAGRCQVMAATATESRPSTLVSAVRSLLLDVSDGMTVPEQLIARSLIGQMLARTVRLAGVDSRPEVARAFIGFIEAGGRAHDWRMRLTQVLDCCEAALGSGAMAEPTLDDRVVRAVKYIQEHGGDGPLSLRQLARTVHVSPWHLARMLKQQTGQGFVAHLHQVRIAAACRRLEQTVLSVKEIAVAVGYDSSSQFDRRFKRHVGVTPMSYRRAMFGRLHQTS